MTLPATLVAATDFSQDADRAAHRAAMLAQEHQLPLALLHALDVDKLTALAAWLKGKADVEEAMAGQAGVQLSVAADALRQQFGIEPAVELRHGAPLAELSLLSALSGSSGLLVLGAHGRRTVREQALGTTADRLLRKSRVPMLVVKAEPAGPYRQVLALTDFSPASQSALHLALSLAPSAAFRLLHAYELPYDDKLFMAGVADSDVQGFRASERGRALAQMRTLLQGLGEQQARVTVSVEYGEVRHQAMAAIKEFAPELIVVGKQGQSKLEDFFLGSVTRAMLAEAPCDVLMAPS